MSREGATLYSVAEAAETLGFHTRGIRASYDHLLKVELPAIVHWEGFHYIVLYAAGPDRVIVADPAIGLRKLSREEFEKGWTGYLLLLTPTPTIEKVEESKTTYGRFLPLLKPYRSLLFQIFVASLLMQLFGLASPIFTQIIVDKVLVHKSTSMQIRKLWPRTLEIFRRFAATRMTYYYTCTAILTTLPPTHQTIATICWQTSTS